MTLFSELPPFNHVFIWVYYNLKKKKYILNLQNTALSSNSQQSNKKLFMIEIFTSPLYKQCKVLFPFLFQWILMLMDLHSSDFYGVVLALPHLWPGSLNSLPLWRKNIAPILWLSAVCCKTLKKSFIREKMRTCKNLQFTGTSCI